MRPALRLLFISLLASAVVAVGASAQSDPFSGTWTATDLDGSNETITFTLQAGGTYRVDLYDDKTGVCGQPAGPAIHATGSATVQGNTLTGTLDDIQCESGTPTVASAPIKFDFDPGSGTLTDGAGIVWRRLQAQILTVADAAVRVAWRESRANGRVVVSGTVGAPSELTITLAREAAPGKTVAHASVSAPSPGPFTVTAKLPATSIPGAYVLHVGGTSGGVEIPSVDRHLVVPAPSEGVVDRAWISARPGGRPAGTLSGPQRELWADFHFVARPTSSTVAVSWIAPSGKAIGTFSKPYTERVESSLGSALPLEKGVWQAVLKAKGKIVKRATVRIR